MPYTFAGISINPTSGESAALTRFWHGHRLDLFTHPAYKLDGIDHLPIPEAPKREPPRVGVLHWPTGASRWAYCHLVCTSSELSRIMEAIGAAPAEPGPQTLVFTDGERDVETEMYFLSAHPIGQRGNGGDYYLLTLVDERYFWWMSGDQAAPSSPASWSDLLDTLFTSLGVTATIDTVDSRYQSPSSRWDVGYKPLPLLIDAACTTVGLRVIRQLDGAVRCITYTNAKAEDSANWTEYREEVIAGGQLAIDELALSVPESVATVFNSETDPSSVTTVTLASNPPGLDTGYGGAVGIPDRLAQIVADLDASADVTQRGNYAEAATADYYNWALCRTDCTLRGFFPRPFSGFEDCQEWAHTPAGPVTRVIRPAIGDRNIYGTTAVLPAAGTITVRSVDGVPSYTGIDTILFDELDGFSLSNPAATWARIDLLDATAAQAGKVNTSSQTFGGHKTFTTGITSQDDSVFEKVVDFNTDREAGVVLTVATESVAIGTEPVLQVYSGTQSAGTPIDLPLVALGAFVPTDGSPDPYPWPDVQDPDNIYDLTARSLGCNTVTFAFDVAGSTRVHQLSMGDDPLDAGLQAVLYCQIPGAAASYRFTGIVHNVGAYPGAYIRSGSAYRIVTGSPGSETEAIGQSGSIGGATFIGGIWTSGTFSAGSVTSVALSLPAIFSVTGSPVTTSGTLTATLANQSANMVWAGPSSGSPAAPTFRALVDDDIPNDITVDGGGF